MSRDERPEGAADGAAPTALVVARPQTLSRRGVLGGALATVFAVVLGGERVRAKPGPNRWNGRTRWIGHC